MGKTLLRILAVLAALALMVLMVPSATPLAFCEEICPVCQAQEGGMSHE